MIAPPPSRPPHEVPTTGRLAEIALSLSKGLRLRVEIVMWRHGAVWALLLAFGTGVAVAAGFLLGPGEAQVRQLETAVSQAQVRTDLQDLTRGHASELPPIAAAQQLVELLPPRAALTEQILRLHELARDSQLQLSQVAYVDAGGQEEGHAQDGTAGDFVRVRVSLPLRASYPRLRSFLEAVLTNLPNASLDQLSVRRGSVGDAQVEAAVQLSMWQRRDAAPMLQTPRIPEEPRTAASGSAS